MPLKVRVLKAVRVPLLKNLHPHCSKLVASSDACVDSGQRNQLKTLPAAAPPVDFK